MPIETPKWIQQELEELRKAPFGVITLLVIGFVVGGFVGQQFYSERVEVMDQRRQLAEDRSSANNSVKPESPKVPTPDNLVTGDVLKSKHLKGLTLRLVDVVRAVGDHKFARPDF